MNEATQGDRIRLILLDEQTLLRASLSRVLALQPGLEVVGECGTSADALEILHASPVDVVLLDFNHCTEGSEGFISAARRDGYRGQFLIVAEAGDLRNSAIAIKLGASGIFLKSEPLDRLVQAINLVAGGVVWFDRKIIRLLADQPLARFSQLDGSKSGTSLLDREQKVLLGILGGLTNRKIGDNLGLSESSVKACVQQLFHKMGARTRSQLVRAALVGSLKTANGSRRRTRNAIAACSPASPATPD